MTLSGWQTVCGLRTEITNQINDDVASLSEVYLTQGPDAVDAAISQRLALSPLSRAGAHYRFEDQGGLPRSGDLSAAITQSSKLTDPTIVQSTNFGSLTLRATVFQGGETLIVARENSAIRKAAWVQLRNTVIGLVALIALAALIAVRATGSLRQRIGQMNDTLDHVGKGHLDARLPETGQEDELGALASHINGMIGRAERLLNLRKRVTDQVAHEMRSPLTRLDAALLKAQSNTRADPALAKARAELKSSLRLLDGLLDVSSAEAQQGDRRNLEPVDLAELGANMVELFEPVAELRRQHLVLEARAKAVVDAAPAQIGRLISNLIDNALKYADPNTDIIISIDTLGNKAVLSVANQGPQILGDLRSEIFTPFFRHPDMAEKQGHGLGLALCRSIALRHDGTLDITPNPHLTIFTLTLPLTEQS